MEIGNWVKREGAFRGHKTIPDKWVGPRWHLVESVVASAAVTRCGNTMQRQDARGRELEVRDEMPLTRVPGQPQLCRAGCARPGMVVFNNEEGPVENDAVPL